jgi:hypothetical protein
MANGSGKCWFEWDEEISQTVTLHGCCTRQLGYQGWHVAGAGEWVAAVHPGQSMGRTGAGRQIPFLCDEDVDDLAVLVNRPVQKVQG